MQTLFAKPFSKYHFYTPPSNLFPFSLDQQEFDSYSEPTFLNPETSTSAQFLRDCTYFVDLTKIYNIKSTCYNNQAMMYCPIQLKVQDQIKDFFQNGDFLIQVWAKEGKKVFEASFFSTIPPLFNQFNHSGEVVTWSVLFNYFMYKPEVPDENHQYIHLVNLEKANSMYLINTQPLNMTIKYLAYSDGMLYAADTKQIKLLALQDQLQPGGVVETVEPAEEDLMSINPGKITIHGLLQHATGLKDKFIFVCVETVDNQIDFNQLYITNKEPKSFSYSLKQMREIVARNINFDPVVKYTGVFRLIDGFEFQTGVAIRASKQVDFYFNLQKCSTTESTFQDVEINFDRIYLKGFVSDIYFIPTILKTKISIENSTPEQRVKFAHVHFQKLKNNCNLFQSYTVSGKNLVLVAHGNILSFFNTQTNSWIEHFKYDADIVHICRQKKAMGQYVVFVILKSGQLYQIKFKSAGEEEERLEIEGNVETKLKGDFTHYSKDRETNSYFLIHQIDKDDPNKAYLYLVYKDMAYDVTEQVPFLTGIQQYPNPQLSPIVQHKSTFLYMNKEGSTTAQFILQKDKSIHLLEVEEMKDPNGTPIVKQLVALPNVEKLAGVIHSGLRSKNERYMFLIDNINFYKYDGLTNIMTVYEDQNCVGAYLSDGNYLYTLSNPSLKSNDRPVPGFRVYDIENIISKDTAYSYLLTANVYVGCQGHIDYNFFNQRMVYQASFNVLEIVPFLHRNTLNFIGMEQQKASYLSVRQVGDKVIGLDNQGRLNSWSLLTGKKMPKTKTPSHNPEDYKDYEVFAFKKDADKVYTKGWYDRILLKKKTAIQEPIDDNKHYDPAWYTPSYIEHQESFIKRTPKTYFEFKVIEIINESTIVEHFQFIHPVYQQAANQEYLYFSDDLEYMFERLANSRQFLYRRTKLNDGNKVKWELAHRFRSIPSELQLELTEKNDHPFFMSPDFTKYLDIDRKRYVFLIRDTMSENVIYEIPKHLMSCTSSTIGINGSMFRWVTNNIIQIFNNEGFERRLDINNNFSEIAYNAIPLFDSTIYKKRHYYYDQPVINNQNILGIYIRKYQQYKSGYYLDGKRDMLGLKQICLSTITMGLTNQEKYVSKLSFSFLHWKIIEMLLDGRLTVDKIEESQIRQLLYVVLPGGDTLLHKLCKRGDIIQYIMKIAHPNVGEELQIKYPTPLLDNFQEKSVIAKCAEIADYKTINMFLEYLCLYGIDHHSRALSNELPLVIPKNLSNMLNYLDSRVRQTERQNDVIRGSLIQQNITVDDGISACCVAPIWYSPSDRNMLVDTTSEDQEIKLEFIDIPRVHEFNNLQSTQFFQALADTEDFSLFERTAIKRLIEFKWPLVLKYIIIRLFIPFVIYMAMYLTYMNRLYYERDIFPVRVLAFQVILTALALYLLISEIQQFAMQGFSYLISVWNYLDFGPPLLLLVFFALQISGFFEDFSHPSIEASLQATMSLGIWLKLLYFLRIFQATGYLIRSIMQVIVDMRYFLLILLLTFVAFGDAINSINTSNEEIDKFTGDTWIESIFWIYRLALGDIQLQPIGNVARAYVYILFILCTVFNMIIMLNLLIAIISDSFSKITAISEQTSYQEKASMIAENTRLIPLSAQIAYCPKDQYLLVATDTQVDDEKQNENIGFLVGQMKKQLSVQIEDMQSKVTVELQKRDFYYEETKKENKKILDMLQEIKSKLPKSD